MRRDRFAQSHAAGYSCARRRPIAPPRRALALVLVAAAATPSPCRGDESGASFWQPGAYDSLAAYPNEPGWSVNIVSLVDQTRAGSSVTAARLMRVGLLDPTLAGSVSASSKNFDSLTTITPGYLVETPFSGIKVEFSLSTSVGRSTTHISGMLAASANVSTTFPLSADARNVATSFSLGGASTGFGDLSPQVTLYGKNGDHYFMSYATGNIPVGEYQKLALVNLGLGHGAVDGGVGYTYYSYDSGLEFSSVVGLTYNIYNSSTNYRSGVDFHLDSGASKYFNDNFFVGPAGYFYRDIGCDSGSGDKVGCFRSQVGGLGAQLGYTFLLGKAEGYLNLKGYEEVAAVNRPGGWNARFTLTLSPAPADSTAKSIFDLFN